MRSRRHDAGNSPSRLAAQLSGRTHLAGGKPSGDGELPSRIAQVDGTHPILTHVPPIMPRPSHAGFRLHEARAGRVHPITSGLREADIPALLLIARLPTSNASPQIAHEWVSSLLPHHNRYFLGMSLPTRNLLAAIRRLACRMLSGLRTRRTRPSLSLRSTQSLAQSSAIAMNSLPTSAAVERVRGPQGALWQQSPRIVAFYMLEVKRHYFN
jgi:hypothetical protein